MNEPSLRGGGGNALVILGILIVTTIIVTPVFVIDNDSFASEINSKIIDSALPNNVTNDNVLSYDLDTEKSEATVLGFAGTPTPPLDVVIPDTITVDNVEYDVVAVGASAFRNKDVSSVTIGANCKTIGFQAFMYNNVLSTLDLSTTNIETLSDGAFSSCTKLSILKLPNTLKSIGNDAFWNAAITSVDIPASVINMNPCAFYECSKLLSINVDLDNNNYASYDGVVYNKEKTALLIYPAGKEGTFAIPDGVTRIGEDAFRQTKVTALTNTERIIEISPRAFWGSSIISVDFENAVTLGDSVFYNCKNLVDANLPNMTTCGESLFQYSSVDTAFIPKLQVIAQDTFSGCESLTTVDISSATSIEYGAFKESSIKSIIIPATVTVVKDSAFERIQSMEITFEGKDTSLSDMWLVIQARDEQQVIRNANGKANPGTYIIDASKIDSVLAFSKIGGPCGSENEGAVWWKFICSRTDGNIKYGTIELSGNGDMKDITGTAPWWEWQKVEGLRYKILQVTIDSGIEYVGDNAFKDVSPTPTVINKSANVKFGTNCFIGDYEYINEIGKYVPNEDGKYELKGNSVFIRIIGDGSIRDENGATDIVCGVTSYTINGEKVTFYDSNNEQICIITAYPGDMFNFSAWDGLNPSGGSISSDIEVTAVFTFENDPNLETESDGGKVTIDPPGTKITDVCELIQDGDKLYITKWNGRELMTVTLTANADSGYTFDKWNIETEEDGKMKISAVFKSSPGPGPEPGPTPTPEPTPEPTPSSDVDYTDLAFIGIVAGAVIALFTLAFIIGTKK